jgi:hypothetical protein
LRRLAAAGALLGMLAVVVVLVATRTPFGGWVRSLAFGVRWQDAYVALETAEANLPRDPRERERLLLAWALVDGPAPASLPSGPRLHRAGTVARLRYEALDEVGEAYDTWEVRALVPPLPALDDTSGPLGRPGCPAECQEALARGGTRLERSGDPGIAPEWVLRMPVDRPLDLAARPIATQDLFDREPRRLALQSLREGDHEIRRPAGLRVTLLEACEADVRVGSITHLDFEPTLIVPIFRGFRRRWWAQADGCAELLRPPARPEAAPVLPAPAPPPVPEPPPTPTPEPIPVPPSLPRIAAPPPRHGPPPGTRAAGEARTEERVALYLPRETALFRVRWIEGDADGGQTARETRLTSGAILCNDVMLGPPPPGRIPVCVPFPDHAEARFVPQPPDECGP